MNTQIKFDRRYVLPISVLLTMLWLPLTTYAQGFTKPAHLQNLQNCEKTTAVLPASKVPNSRSFSEGFGFSETAPADQPAPYTAVASRSPFIPQKHAINGFSETDPANEPSTSIGTIVQSFAVSEFVNVGFSETDPVANMDKSIGEIDHQKLAGCPDRNARGVALEASELSGLTIKGKHHDFG